MPLIDTKTLKDALRSEYGSRVLDNSIYKQVGLDYLIDSLPTADLFEELRLMVENHTGLPTSIKTEFLEHIDEMEEMLQVWAE